MRIFLGVQLRSPILEEIAQFQQLLPYGRPVPEQNLHLTLHFLGEIEEPKLSKIFEVCEAAGHLRATLQPLDRLLALPSPKKALLLALGAHQTDSGLLKIAHHLKSSLLEKGFALEKRKFLAHVTLMRLKDATNVERALEGAKPSFQLPIPSVTLYQSHTLPEGAKYLVMKEFSLAAP